MCGINGILVKDAAESALFHHLKVMNQIIKHRGPDDDGVWVHKNQRLGFGHTRLSIIDLSEMAHQPFVDPYGNVLVFNGEIYNYIELRERLKSTWQFKTESDTEVMMAAYHHYGVECLQHFEGMFAFALWDAKTEKLFLARDRVGIKPLYYYSTPERFYFSSEVKALLPFLDQLKVNNNSLTEYLIFQYPLQEQLLFDEIEQLLPGEMMIIDHHKITKQQYWEIAYNETYADPKTAERSFQELMSDTMTKHIRSDVPIGSYLSGGLDSSLITLLAHQHSGNIKYSINGRFLEAPDFDESEYAKLVAQQAALDLEISTLTADDFINNIIKIIYHLDYPIAGPGAFPQYMVSQQASRRSKVMLGGQGADELFGGYARYLLMHLGEMINNAIDNKISSADIAQQQTIFQQLGLLQQYKPLFAQFMRQDCFADHAKRYYHLINRAVDLNQDEVDWQSLPVAATYARYEAIFNNSRISGQSVLNKVTHFDFKCSLPALLHVEDRMSMAHGLESRVPFVDHRVVEFAANLSTSLKFGPSGMKGFLKNTYEKLIPSQILQRKDKMGFPVPINHWSKTCLKEFIIDTLSNSNSSSRPFISYGPLLKDLSADQYSRKIWAMLSLELWFQQFFDKHQQYKNLLTTNTYVNMDIVI